MKKIERPRDGNRTGGQITMDQTNITALIAAILASGTPRDGTFDAYEAINRAENLIIMARQRADILRIDERRRQKQETSEAEGHNI